VAAPHRTESPRGGADSTRRSRGIAAVRLDLPGLGDSEGTTPKIYERYDRDNADAVAALAATYDQLEASNVASRFVSSGSALGDMSRLCPPRTIVGPLASSG